MKKRIFKVISLILLMIIFVSCTDASRAKLGGYGDEFKVQLINCDGTITHEWISSGKVLNQENSDGHFFNDKVTGNLIEVTGTVIITKQ